MRRVVLTVLAILLTLPRLAAGQADIYRGGDGTTTVLRGQEACGTLTSYMNALDGDRYETWAAAENAARVPALRAGVPSPMGRDMPETTAPFFGATVVNPGNTPITVTQVLFEVPEKLFDDDTLGIQPTTTWEGDANKTVTWTGSVSVPRNSALDFIVRIRPKSDNFTDIPVTITATTSVGVLTAGPFTTSVGDDDDTPGVNLTYIEGTTDSFAGVQANGGAVTSGDLKTFFVRIRESEDDAREPIPAGTALQITIPAAWSDVSVLPNPNFGSPTVTQPTACATGSIQVLTAVPVLRNSIDYFFTARAPADQGAVGIYVFDTWLTNPSPAPPINAHVEYVQVVTPVQAPGTLDGILTTSTLVAVPHPMARGKFSTFGAALANPTDDVITATRVRIFDPASRELFKAVRPIEPATGWTRVSISEVRWTGAAIVDPHGAEDFLCEIQGDGKDIAGLVGLTVEIQDSLGMLYTSTLGQTRSDGGHPGASLYYLVSGIPALYMSGVGGGQARTFRVAVRESEGTNIPSGAELTVVVPAGWSAVSAASGQASFAAPTITQPTAVTDGLISVLTNQNIKKKTVSFDFTATAPTGVLESLYRFETRLVRAGASQVNALAEGVVQVSDQVRGLAVEHVSPPIADAASTNQIDVHVVGRTEGDEDIRLDILNAASAVWEPLASASFTGVDQSFFGSVSADFLSYFSSDQITVRLETNGIENHRLGENLVEFIISRYRMAPNSVAPASAPQGRPLVPLEELVFSVQVGMVTIETLKVKVTGTDPLADVSQVRLIDDVNCNGVPDVPAEGDLWLPQPLAADATATFGTAGSTLLDFDSATPACALVTVDLTLASGIGNVVAMAIPNGTWLTSDVGPYPVPSVPGYPVASGDVVITTRDTDLDGIPDADELTLGTDASDADTDDDGIPDGEEVGLDLVFDLGVDTDPLDFDSDGDGLSDGLEAGVEDFMLTDDADGDGTPDERDPQPTDPLVKGTDIAVFTADEDPTLTTEPLDADSDDDGLPDGVEDADGDGHLDMTLAAGATAGSGETDPNSRDSDGDGVQDGTELGLAAPLGSDTDMGLFQADAEPASTTDPLDDDSDDDGLMDGTEDANLNGMVEGVETDPNDLDSDADLLPDGLESGLVAPLGGGTDPAVFQTDVDPTSTTEPLDDDSDDDGLMDGTEDADQNGRADLTLATGSLPGAGETDPNNLDSDGDGIQDGTELGLALPAGAGTDMAVFRADADPASTTSPLDDDSDDDGLQDGAEDADFNGRADMLLALGGTAGSGETDPTLADSDADGIQDGTELGLAAPAGAGSDPAVFVPDADPASTTDPLDDDGDDDGLPDGAEDADHNGRADTLLALGATAGSGDTDPTVDDTDGDGIQDGTELGLETPAATGTDPTVFVPDADPATTTSPLDDDSDDDGLTDDAEDANRNGMADNILGGSGSEGSGETDAALLDSDGDGCQDGTESGLAVAAGVGTDPGVFYPDEDPATATSPLDTDTDDDGVSDSEEDLNCNGKIDPGEGDPGVSHFVLRNDEIRVLRPLDTLLVAIFTGTPPNSLDLNGPDGVPDLGEGDDDDTLVGGVPSPWVDPDAVVSDPGRPLVFYQLTKADVVLKLIKEPDASHLRLFF